MSRMFLFGAAVLAVASIFWFSTTPSAPRLDMVSAEAAPAVSPDSPSLPPPASPIEHADPASGPGETERVSDEATAAGDWTMLRQRLDDMGDEFKVREVRDEADRLFGRWLKIDRDASLAWIEGHRGDARFDRLVANAAQTLIAKGAFEEAQNLAAQIVEDSTRDWVNEEVWSVAYERRLVSAQDLKESGLSPEAQNSISSGSRRD